MRVFRFLILSLLAISAAVHAFDYAPLHRLLIKFYGYQRAGLSGNQNPYNPFYDRAPYPHASDNHNGADLSGGWYDAGDFVKFGLPMGWSVYCLLKGFDVFPRGYDDVNSWDYSGRSDNIPDVLNEAKFATDYLIKAVVSENTVIMDVGNAHQDHQQWVSGYQSTAVRTVYTCNGADVPGLYAAALALMARLYRNHDRAYAAVCSTKARQAFAFAVKNQRVSAPQRNPSAGNTPFYETLTFKDKMACGAVELYRLTNENLYLEWAKTLMADVKSHFYVMGYAHAGDIAAFEMARLGFPEYSSSWIADVNMAISRVITSDRAALVKGAFVNSDWGVCRDAANAAFSAALAYMIRGEARYKDFAIQQINWIAGIAPYTKSYVIGYNNGPRNPHHRNSNVLGIPINGGIVSGPTPQGGFDPSNPGNSTWSFTDSKDLYQNTEVACDYNAGAIGAIAFIRDYLNPPPGLVRIAQALTATPDPADLNQGSVRVLATFETSVSWTLTLIGQVSNARKSYTGTGTSINVQWNGESDQGTFVSGENVTCKIENVPNIASYHQGLTTVAFFLSSLKREQPTARDILVDDFNDSNAVNLFGGIWRTFKDSVFGGTSYTQPSTIGASAFTSNGESGTKGLLIRMIGRPGAPNPHAGALTTFNAAGTPVAAGPITSIMFDVRTTGDSGTFWVELAQPTITDGAYHAAKVTLRNNQWNRIRIPVSSFQQHTWKSASVPLNNNSISSLRFTYYGTSSLQLILDNVRIQDLSIGSGTVGHGIAAGRMSEKLFHLAGNKILLGPEGLRASAVDVFRPDGVCVYRMRRSVSESIGTMDLTGLAAGKYLIRIEQEGKVEMGRFVIR